MYCCTELMTVLSEHLALREGGSSRSRAQSVFGARAGGSVHQVCVITSTRTERPYHTIHILYYTCLRILLYVENHNVSRLIPNKARKVDKLLRWREASNQLLESASKHINVVASLISSPIKQCSSHCGVNLGTFTVFIEDTKNLDKKNCWENVRLWSRRDKFDNWQRDKHRIQNKRVAGKLLPCGRWKQNTKIERLKLNSFLKRVGRFRRPGRENYERWDLFMQITQAKEMI